MKLAELKLSGCRGFANDSSLINRLLAVFDDSLGSSVKGK